MKNLFLVSTFMRAFYSIRCKILFCPLQVVYLFKVYQSSNSYASQVMAHAALQWFHSFGLSNGANPLDSSICHNLLEAARRNKPVTVKKGAYLR